MKNLRLFTSIWLSGLFVLFLSFLVLTAQAGQVYSIRQITNANGLSNSSVNKVFQDSEDLVWVGTWDGLNLYNGSDFTVFHPELSNPNCISNQVILDIAEDRQGRIWINTNHGINRYDKKTNRFTRYYFSRKNISPTSEYEFHIAGGDSGIVFCAAKDWGIGYARGDSILLLHRIEKRHSVKKMLFFPPSSLMVQYVSGELQKLTLDFPGDKTVRLKSIDPFVIGVSDFIVHPDDGLFLLLNEGTFCRYSEEKKEKMTVLLRDINRIAGTDEEMMSKLNLDVAMKNRLLGESYFLRAFYYFDLVTIYGDVPLLLTPLASFEEAYEVSVRVDKATVWQQISDDLQDAKELLPNSRFSSNTDKWRASKGAVISLQAKVALFREQWQEMINLVTELEGLGFYDLNANYFDSFDVTKEFAENEVIFAYDHQEAQTPRKGNGLCALLGWGFVAPESNFLQEFEANDPRLLYTVDAANQNVNKILEQRDARVKHSGISSQSRNFNYGYKNGSGGTLRTKSGSSAVSNQAQHGSHAY